MQSFKYVKYLLLILALAAFTGCGKTKKQPLRIKGKKLIQTTPAGASIIYNGKEIGKTPYTISANPNFYVIKLTKYGYRPRYASFTVKAGENTPVNINLEPANASALIESKPAGAYVTFNGKRIGETPCVLPDLPFGTHTVSLAKGGFASQDLQFDITSDRPLKVSTSLQSNIGTLIINSTPNGAKVLLNGKHVGVTPFNGEYPDGEYKLTLQHSNHIEYTTPGILTLQLPVYPAALIKQACSSVLFSQ
jgi:hypothetical protein